MSTDARPESVPTPAGAVVAAIDGSERDAAVIDWAAGEAALVDAPLHLVHALDLGAPLSAYGEILSSPQLVDQIEDDSARTLREARERALAAQPEISVSTSMPTGSPAGAVLEASEGASVLVVGSRRTTAAQRAVLGTTTLSIAAHARIPVVVVPEGCDITGDDRVVVGVDGSEHSRLAADFALDLAARSGREVVAVTTWHVEVERGVVVTEEDSPEWAAVEQRYRSLVESTIAAPRRAHPDVPVTIEVRRGRAAETLVEMSKGSDLLVVGSRGRGGFRGLLLGSISQRVLESATTPVAVLHRR